MGIKTTEAKQVGKGVFSKMSLMLGTEGVSQDYSAGLLTGSPKSISVPLQSVSAQNPEGAFQTESVALWLLLLKD